MELFNTVQEDRLQEIEDFITFMPIYKSKRREIAYQSLLKKYAHQIKGKICCEAGAARGIFSRYMAEDLQAQKVYAVERSAALFKILEANHSQIANMELVEGYIEDLEPQERIDVLLHEFYGPLVLDETIYALQDLEFKPGTILPDGGTLWAMPLTEEQVRLKSPMYDPSWKEVLQDTLISELFEKVKFEPKWKVFDWDIHSEAKEFEFTLPESCDFLAFCGEITHEGKSVLKMWWTHNWPLIFTPVNGRECRFRFDYIDGFTDVYFNWKD